MMLFIVFSISLLWGCGLYFLLTGLNKTPGRKTIRAMEALKKQKEDKEWNNGLQKLIQRCGKRLSPMIHLDSLRKESLQSALELAQMDRTPEEHTAWSMSCTLVFGMFSLLFVPFYWIHTVLAAAGMLGIIVIAVVYGLREYGSVKKKLSEEREKIEAEIPQFAASISELLTHRAHITVAEIIGEYRKMAGKTFRRELERTLADLRSSNTENALLRLDHRINSVHLSEVIRGLIGILRGDDETVYFQTMALNLREYEIAGAKKKASVIPNKLRRKTMLLLFPCLLFMIFVMLGTVQIRTNREMIFMLSKKLWVLTLAALCLCSLSALYVSTYFYFETKEKNVASEETRESLEQELLGLKKQLNIQAADGAANKEKNTKTNAAASDPAGTALNRFVEQFLHAYYDCDEQRTGAELMDAVSGYLTPSAQQGMAPAGSDSGPADKKHTYQSRITVNSTYLRTVDPDTVVALSICTLKVTNFYGSTDTALFVRTENHLETGRGKWKIHTVTATQASDLPIEQIR